MKIKNFFRKFYTKTSNVDYKVEIYTVSKHHNTDSFISILTKSNFNTLQLYNRFSNNLNKLLIEAYNTEVSLPVPQDIRIAFEITQDKLCSIDMIIKNLKNITVENLYLSLDTQIHYDIIYFITQNIKDTNIRTIKYWYPIHSELKHDLIKYFKNTSVTSSTDFDCDEIKQVLQDNKNNIIKLRKAFKTLVYKTNHQLEFDISRIDSEKCIDIIPYLEFIKTINNVQPHAVYHYLREESYTKNEIQHFIKNIENKFAAFIAMKLDGNSTDYTNVLMICENMQLEYLTKTLLLHRPLYLIEPKLGILHPYFYQILKKYNMPLYNEQLEPSIKEKILSYYDNHPEVDGAQNVINLLGSESIEVYI